MYASVPPSRSGPYSYSFGNSGCVHSRHQREHFDGETTGSVDASALTEKKQDYDKNLEREIIRGETETVTLGKNEVGFLRVHCNGYYKDKDGSKKPEEREHKVMIKGDGKPLKIPSTVSITDSQVNMFCFVEIQKAEPARAVVRDLKDELNREIERVNRYKRLQQGRTA